MNVVITEEYNFMVSSEELTGTTECLKLWTRCRKNDEVTSTFHCTFLSIASIFSKKHCFFFKVPRLRPFVVVVKATRT